MQIHISFRSRTDLVLDAEHSLDFSSYLILQACISFCSVSDKSGVSMFLPFSHRKCLCSYDVIISVFFPRGAFGRRRSHHVTDSSCRIKAYLPTLFSFNVADDRQAVALSLEPAQFPQSAWRGA